MTNIKKRLQTECSRVAILAQLVEQLICNQQVVSSNLTDGSTAHSSSGQDSGFSFLQQEFDSPMGYKQKRGTFVPLFQCPISQEIQDYFVSYLRNKPTSTNKATRPTKPDSPKLFMMDVRLPITFTPKNPLPKTTSEIAPIATKDIMR